MMIILKCIEIPHHYVVHQELTQLLYVSYTSETNKLIEKEIRFVVIRGTGWGEGKLDEGGRNVQTSSCKINKY